MKRHDWDDKWILDNYASFETTKELYNRYVGTHEDDLSYDTFKWHVRTALGLQRQKFHMSEEQEQFIIDNFGIMTVERLRKKFNKTFGLSFKTTAFHYHTKRLGLDKWKEHIYTDEQEQFLEENAPFVMRRQLTQMFNKRFGASVKEDALVMHCWQRGYGALNDGRFAQDRKFAVFLDGDRNNFEESNVRSVGFGVYSSLNQNGWLNGCKRITETAITWCELRELLAKEVENIEKYYE